MSVCRQDFLQRVRAAQPRHEPAQPYPLPELPRFAPAPGEHLARFRTHLELMGGTSVALASPDALAGWCAERFPGARALTATPEAAFAEPLDVARAPASLHDVELSSYA